MINDVLQKIKELKTGELNKDIEIVSNILNEHQDEPYINQLKMECGLILYSLTLQNDAELCDITKEGMEIFSNKLSEISKSLIKTRLENLESEVLTLAKMIEKYVEFENTDSESYFSFTNDLEILLYMAFCGSDESFRVIPYDFASLYNLNGIINMRLKNYKIARSNFQRALRWNPLDLGALYQMVDTYRCEDDWHRYYQEILKALDITYETRYLSIGYTMLGHYV